MFGMFEYKILILHICISHTLFLIFTKTVSKILTIHAHYTIVTNYTYLLYNYYIYAV